MSDTARHGAVGALLDEYARAIKELQKLIETIPGEVLTRIIDPHTHDENCRSVQSILTHVVSAGFGYATSIYNLKGHNAVRPDKVFHREAGAYINDLDKVFAFTEHVFAGVKDHELEEYNEALKIRTSWGQHYDREQLMEHAIVHILRHRRQIAGILARI